MQKLAKSLDSSKRASDRPALSPGEISALLYAPPQGVGNKPTPTKPPVAIAPVIPPALAGPQLLDCGAPYDAWNDYWEARQSVLAFLRSPESFARGLLEEIRRQGVPVTGTLTDLEDAVFRLRRRQA